MRKAAPLLLVLALSLTGVVLSRHAVDADRRRAAVDRAAVDANQVRSTLERARAYAVGLANALEGDPAPSGRRFAALEGSATAAVGLPTALWVEAVPGQERAGYEARTHRRIRTLDGRVARPADAYLPATFVVATPLRAGADVSGVAALADTLRQPIAIFAGTATPETTFEGRRGFFLVQGAHFGAGPGSSGFLVVFVPSGWLTHSQSFSDDPRRVAVSLDGRRLEGALSGKPAAGVTFEEQTRRWRVDVAREPATSVQAALPWVALLWPPAVALLVWLIARGILRRRRAERQVDDIFELSPELLCVAGLDGYFKRVNPAFEQTLGYTTVQLLARPLLEFVHPDDRKPTQDALVTLEHGGTLRRFENRYLRSDGTVRWLEWTARPLPERGLFYAAARDITDNRVLVLEQAALRRVATLVAEGHDPAELFDAVAAEVGRLLEADATRLLRYEEDGTASVVAAYGAADPALEVGARVSLDRVVELGGARVDAPIVVSGRPWGVIVAAFRDADAVRADTEARIAQFTELVGTAVSNAEGSAALTASRRRIVETADETRRRIERDLHDGAQQRLVQTLITLKVARTKLPDDAPAKPLVEEGLEHAGLAIAEMRELARGIHPAMLTERGLAKALEALADRAPVPVTLEVGIDGRLPAPVEVTAYYIISEALTNVAKHAEASSVVIRLEQRDGSLGMCISDDGVGGADLSRGSGLVGLKDRVEAGGGTLVVDSRRGQGTRLTVSLPLDAAQAVAQGEGQSGKRTTLPLA